MRTDSGFQLQGIIFVHLDLLRDMAADNAGITRNLALIYNLVHTLPVLFLLFERWTNKPRRCELKIMEYYSRMTDDLVHLPKGVLML